jgi:hypothetical protein
MKAADEEPRIRVLLIGAAGRMGKPSMLRDSDLNIDIAAR